MQSVIVKEGGSVEFTLQKIDDDRAYLTKARKEVSGQTGISKATMENIKRTHPHITAMSTRDLTAAYLYREALGVVTSGEAKIAQIDKAFADYDVEKVEILKQTGIVLSDK